MDQKRKPARRLSKAEAESVAISIATAYLVSHPQKQWQGKCVGVSPITDNEAVRIVLIEWSDGRSELDGPSGLRVDLETGCAEGWL